jgi:hypothetical protein
MRSPGRRRPLPQGRQQSSRSASGTARPPLLARTLRHKGARVRAPLNPRSTCRRDNQNSAPHPRAQGCYDIGLPSHKSLFQLQAERLLALQRLAAQANGGRGRPLLWFVMTSPFTHADTV